MSRLRWVVSAWLIIGAASGASAYTVEVTSSPAGAEVYASPADQPAAYLKGRTPCVLELGDGGAPHVLIVRSAGHFRAHRYTRPGDASVAVTLQALDDPEVWQRLPGIVSSPLEERRRRGMWLVRGGLPVGPLNEGLPDVPNLVEAWAPDGSGAAVRGARLTFGDEPNTADLWWAPLQGQPQHVWRASTPSDLYQYSIPECSFSPDPRWLVCSAGVAGAEHLRLHCLATGQSRGIARDDDATLYSPSVSPGGRWVAFVRAARISERTWWPCELHVMRSDGSERRKLATGVVDTPPPAFSPDERTVAYVSDLGEVSVIPTAGGESRVVWRHRNWSPAAKLIWSPGGRRVAVTCEPWPDDDISRWQRREEGVSRYRTMWGDLTDGSHGAVRACRLLRWFDEESIIGVVRGFVPEFGLSYEQVCLIGLDGEVRKTLLTPRVLVHRPALSPDGTRVAVVGWHPDAPADLCVYDRASCSLANLTGGRHGQVTEVGWVGDRELRAATSGVEGITHLVVSLDGSEVRQVPEPPEIIRNPGPREGYIRADGDLHLNPPDDLERRITWFGKVPDLAPTPRAEDEQP